MIVNVILGVILPLILLLIAVYLFFTYRDEKVLKWVRIAVKAAEQIYKSPGQGKEKFNYVVDWISAKFKIPKEDLKNLIESAVYELNNAIKDTEQKE
ncbi:MAG: hypothetical protein IJ423_05725 [Clostridia bacterium]|nr:hypothetical protein [Clostridia bacterium]MBQ8637470.1 hypothetical protein [Clostridia bacterium]